MGTMTVVQLVGAARVQLGLLPANTTVVSSQQEIDVQMLALLNQLGSELQQNATWTALQSEQIVNTEVVSQTTGDTAIGSPIITNIPDTSGYAANTWVVTGTGIITSSRVLAILSPTSVVMSENATTTEVGNALTFSKDTYPLADDFGSFVSDTWWDRTNRWSLIGPTSPQMDQFLRSGIVTTTPRRNWRQIGRGVNAWRVWPAPGTTDPALTLVYEYNSLNWATNTAGDGIPAITADTDTCVFPDALMVAGLKLKYFEAKGMDTAALRMTYERLYSTARADDGGDTKLSMSGGNAQPVLLSWWNLPDSGYGGV